MPAAIVYPMVFLMLFNFLGFNCLCTWLNDKSRAVGAILEEILPHNQTIFIWISTFQRKVSDTSWGLTFGTFFLMERTAFIGLISAMITFLALYSQFADSAPPSNSMSLEGLVRG
uniref:Uncharacterized protein n=1 Tax=Plectus sambesii TaxID=2011161 RepID=A0A914XP44_9BILA